MGWIPPYFVVTNDIYPIEWQGVNSDIGEGKGEGMDII